MWNVVQLFRSIMSRRNTTAEPKIEISNNPIENPIVTVVIGHKRLQMTTTQARSLWGKLGQNLERLTPDPKEYRR